MAKIIPEIAVSNMERSLKFYNMLGFAKGEDGIIDEKGSQWCSLEMGDASFWLIREDILPDIRVGESRGNGVNIYMSVDDVDGLYEKVKAGGLEKNIVKEIETLWYGLRQFSMHDPDGYLLTVNMQVEVEEKVEEPGAGS